MSLHFIFLLLQTCFLAQIDTYVLREKTLIKDKRRGKLQKFFFLGIFKLFVSSSLRDA